ncbi:MAG: menaquinone reductase multiheme cytochrome c subunit QrcA [Desulfovibrio sp.]
MEEKKASKRCGGALPFFIGFLAFAVLGWSVIPGMFFTEKEQPFRFSHKIHVEDEGMDCDSCHFFREDGSFAGLPTNEQCVECHEEQVGEDPAEAIYVDEYLAKGKEVPWLVYQYQPDNVYFSHKAHENYECTECHLDVGSMDDNPVYEENIISGYSKNTMKMWECERCHAQNHTSNACYVCHK